MSPFTALPPEIHVEVMQNLDYPSLLRCSSTCRSLYELCKTSSRLQYTIALGMNGMIDAGSALPSLELLSNLRKLRAGWENIEWTRYDKIKIDEDCLAYELVGGVFALSDGLGLKTIQLPSSRIEAHTLERKLLGVLVRDFAIDPTQDLVVILEDDQAAISYEHPRHTRIHIRTISTNERHPHAAHETLSFSIPPDSEFGNALGSVMLQLTDDLLSMFVAKGPAFSAKCRALIWSWQAGMLVYDTDLDGADGSLPPHIREFSLLNRTCFVLASTRESGALLLYTFSPSPSVPPQPPKLAATLHLPPIRPGYRVQRVVIHAGPYHARAPASTLFYTSPEEGVQVVSIAYAVRDLATHRGPGEVIYHYSMFVKTQTLVRYTRGVKLEEGGNGGVGDVSVGVNVEWDQWGEYNTRLFPIVTPMHWLRYVHGPRVACSLSQSFTGPANTFDILDFNHNPHFTHTSPARKRDLRTKPSMSHSTASLLASSDSPSSALDVDAHAQADVDFEGDGDVLSRRGTIYPSHLFEDGLVTRLPYYATTRAVHVPGAGPSTSVFELPPRFYASMVDEERVIGLKMNEGSGMELHVYSF